MKLIHMADLHLGSKLNSNFNNELALIRKEELFLAFLDVINYALNNQIIYIIIAGDLFDTEKRVIKRTLKIIEDYKQLTFFYCMGNHDKQVLVNIPNNLKLFKDEFSYYVVDEVCIGGVEDFSNLTYLDFPTNKYNILTLHGAINIDFTLDDLKNKNINYVALGHIHKYGVKTIEGSCLAVYPGCLEGRGFDEVGEKGFVVIDTITNTHEFIINSKRIVHEVEIDLTEVSDVTYYVLNFLKDYPSKDIIKVILTGSVSINTVIEPEVIKSKLDEIFFYSKVVLKTRLKIDYNDYLNEVSLSGEFVRVVNSSNLNEADKEIILEIGLKCMLGED